MDRAAETIFASRGWRRGALGVALVGVIAILWAAWCSVPGIYWNAPRLAPAFALAEGLPIYATRASAAHLGWHYGPVFPLYSLPATLAGNITASFWIWSGLNLLAICGPVWLVLREVLADRRLVWTGLVFYGLLLLANPITQAMVASIHIDALCTGLGTLACWCVHRAVRERGRYLHGAACAVALAVFTKQLAICLVPALLLWLWWHNHRALVGRFLLWLTIYGLGVAVVFFYWFGGEELMFNLWLIHARTPRWGGWLMVVNEGGRLIQVSWVWWVVLLVAFADARWRQLAQRQKPAVESLLLWVAAFHLPLGLWAVTKVGGGLNSVHALNYFLPVATLWFLRANRYAPLPGATLRFVPAPMVLVVTVLALANAFHYANGIGMKWLPDRSQELILRMARENSHRMYFPWNPLVTIISDQKIYPFDNALFCLSIAGLAPSAEAVRAVVPVNPVIFYSKPGQSEFALNYFPRPHAEKAGENNPGKP